MLCYRCGSFTPDDSRKCSVCGQPIASRRRQSRNLSGSTTTGNQRTIPPFDPGEILAGRYRIVGPAGPGTTGWVLRARDEEVDVDVAVKVLAQNLLQTEDERGRFLKAVKQARKVHHPNVVRIYDEGRGERHLYYTMPYLEGLSLRKIIDLRIERQQVFNFGEALPLFGQLALAIDHLDKFGPHGAIRPNNVVVLPDVLKLTGLPHHRGLPRKPFVALQQKSSCLEYLAPEARREDGSGTVERRSDVYSMAVIFAEMLTGEVYGRDAEKWEAAEAGLQPNLVSVLHRAFSESPKSRHESATVLFEALAAVGASEPAVVVAMPSDTPITMQDETTDAEGRAADMPTVDLSGSRKALQRQDQLDKELAALDKEIDLAREPRRVVSPPREVERAQAMRRIERRGAPPAGRSPWVLMVAAVIVVAGLGVSAAIYYQQRERSAGLADLEPVTEPAITPHDPTVPSSPEMLTKGKSAPDKKRPDRRRKSEPRRREGMASALDRARAATEPTKPPPPAPVEPTPAPISARVPVGPVAPPPPPPPPPTETPEPDPIEVVTAPVPVPEPEPEPAAEAGAVRCPPGMAAVDGGTVEVGSNTSDPMRGFGELNAHRRKLDGFCMDIYEFPNQRGKAPTVNVSWTRAKRACERVNKRLCTEAEWERGCKGESNARFPYGNKYDAAYCNVSEGAGEARKPGPSGVFPRCRSGFGVVDMAGNVAEWTASGWGRGVPDKVVKGGGADQGAYMSRCAARANETASGRAGNIGFRCCADTKK